VQPPNATGDPATPLPPAAIAKSSVVLECGEVRLPYGFEFLGSSFCGGPHSLVVTLPGDRSRMAILQTIASGTGVALAGGLAVGKVETIRSAAGALGKAVVATQCSALLGPTAVSSLVLACFAGCVCAPPCL
jgi:hypothetical protein